MLSHCHSVPLLQEAGPPQQCQSRAILAQLVTVVTRARTPAWTLAILSQTSLPYSYSLTLSQWFLLHRTVAQRRSALAVRLLPAAVLAPASAVLNALSTAAPTPAK